MRLLPKHEGLQIQFLFISLLPINSVIIVLIKEINKSQN